MARFVALFRGINVGKAKRIAMADLRALFARLGYTDVKTLLNSGNAVFTAAGGAAREHSASIRAAVAKKLGVDAVVIVKSAQDIAAIIAGNELGKIASDPSRLLVAMTEEAKALAGLEALAAKTRGQEKLHLNKHAAYVWCANGILESELLGLVLRGLEGTGTTRNWATLTKIHDLLRTSGS